MKQQTLSFSAKNMKLLQQLAEKNGMDCESLLEQVMDMLNVLTRMDEESLRKYITDRLECLHSQQEEKDTAELTKLVATYKSFLTFIPDNNEQAKKELDFPTMKRISLKNGVLVCPSDWLIVNPEDAYNMEYAGLVECKNSMKYNIPHFIFLSNKKYAREYDNSYCEEVNQKCCKAYPRFDKILKMQVEPICDPKCPGTIRNNAEWLAAPTIGYFSIYVQGDTSFGPNHEPPFGARIIHYDDKERKTERLHMRIEPKKKKLLNEFANEDYPSLEDGTKKLSKLIDRLIQNEIDRRMAQRLPSK